MPGSSGAARKSARAWKTKDRALAKRRLAEKHQEIEHLDPAAGKITVEELLRRFLLTLENYDRSTVEKLKFLGDRFKATWKPGLRQQVGDVRASHVLEWLGTIRPKHAKSYYNDHVQFVRRMVDSALSAHLDPGAPKKRRKNLQFQTV